MLFPMKRYFCAHQAIVFFSPQERQYQSRIQNVYKLIHKKWKKTYFIDLDTQEYNENEIENICSQAKVLIFESKAEFKIIEKYKKYIDFFMYEGIFKENKLIKLRFKTKNGEDITKNTHIDIFESPVYNREVKAILSFVRVSGRENFYRRILEACLKGRLFTFLSPTTLLNSLFSMINFIINKFSLGLDKIFGKLFSKTLYKFIVLFYRRKKINNKKIVFRACHHQFSCNPKYIALYLLKNYPNIKIIWLIQKHNYTNLKDFPLRIQLVPNNSLRAIFHLSTAKVFIDNSAISLKTPPRRKGQYLIQTWHGSLGIKKFDTAWNTATAVYNNKQTSYCISNSIFENEVYSTSYWKGVPIKLFGHARNDILFQDRATIKKKVCAILNIPVTSNIVLYGPTFRDQDRAKTGNKNLHALSYYSLDYTQLCNALHEKFGGTWVVIERFHFHLKKFSTFINSSSSLSYNASAYPDMQELIAAADVAITDYSSWIFDFMLTRRPGFLFSTDIEDYKSQRDFYYPLETTPFPLSTSNDELIKNILHFDHQCYIKNVDNFISEKGCIDDGFASKRIGDFIVRLLEEKN